MGINHWICLAQNPIIIIIIPLFHKNCQTTSLHNCQPKKLILQQQILYHFLKQQLLMYLLLQFKCQMQLELCQNYCKIFLLLKNQQQQLPLLQIIRLPYQIRIVLNYYYMACFNQKVVLETYDDATHFSDESNSISILFPPLYFFEKTNEQILLLQYYLLLL